MKKNYVKPSFKVRNFSGDELMNGGLQETSNGGYSQPVDPNNPGETVDGSHALSKHSIWDEEE